MDILINGQRLEFSLENEKTVGDILRAVEQDCSQNNATIISISIDGSVVHDNDFEKVFETDLDAITSIELNTISVDDTILLLEKMKIGLEELIEKLLTVPVLLQSNKDSEVSSIVMAFADQFSELQQAIVFCSLFPEKFANFIIENQTPPDFIKEFTPILQEFESSLVSRDTVLTGDLAEYEVVPRLQAFVTAVKVFCGTLC